MGSRQKNRNELLLEGAFTGNIKLIRKSVENGANVNYTNYNGQTAIAIAAYHGHQEIIKYLVESGAKINVTDRFHFTTPLALAVRNNKMETVNYLLENGANVNLVGLVDGEASESPLSLAIEKQNLGMFQLLIDKGADINAVDTDGNTPLEVAQATGNPEIVHFLQNARAIFFN